MEEARSQMEPKLPPRSLVHKIQGPQGRDGSGHQASVPLPCGLHEAGVRGCEHFWGIRSWPVPRLLGRGHSYTLCVECSNGGLKQ